MQQQFTPCPACGAVGEVGTSCQFCGTTILLKENIFATAERIPSRRTVTPQQYAEKISIYHNIEPIGDCIYKVSIGKQYGVVNINGDLIYPLGDYALEGVSSHPYIIAYGTESIEEYSTTKYYKYSDEETTEHHKERYFSPKGYVKLETIEYANEFGLVNDKDHPNKLYRVNIKDWKPINSYISSGIECNYDYIEYVCKWKRSKYETETLYFIYHEDKKSLWIAGLVDRTKSKSGITEYPMFIFDNVRNIDLLKPKTYDEECKLKIEIIDGDNIILDSSELNNVREENERVAESYLGVKRFQEEVNIIPNRNLLLKVQNFIKEVKIDTQTSKYLYITSENLSFGVIPNTRKESLYELDADLGVSIVLFEESDFTEEGYEIFSDWEYNNIFRDASRFDESPCWCVNCHYDANLICCIIQSLLEFGNESLENIKIDEYNDKPSEQNSFEISNEISNEDNSKLKVIMIILLCGIVAFVLMFALIPA